MSDWATLALDELRRRALADVEAELNAALIEFGLDAKLRAVAIAKALVLVESRRAAWADLVRARLEGTVH